MRTVLVVNAGDETGLNFIRSLHKTNQWFVIGIDVSLSDYHGSEADIRYLFPWDDEDVFVAYVQQIAARHRVDLLYVADTDREILTISRRRHEFDVPTYLPALEDHLRMEDKWVTWQALHKADIPVPDTALVTDEDIVADMLAKHGTVWLRRTQGCSGLGSVATDSLAFAKAWLDREKGWGVFTVAQCLTKRTATLSALWYEGELVASQLRDRMGWLYAHTAVSGVTGITGGQRTVWDEELHELGIACVKAVSDVPHGAIGVDFTYDEAGNALPTEVQPARFYTSMQFLTEVGLNFPALYCDIAINGRGDAPVLRNPIRENFYWVKNVGRLPELLTEDEYFAR